MIERYKKEKMGKIWELDSKFNYFLRVELAVLDAYAQMGEVSKEIVDDIKSKASFNVERIAEIEKETNHDVIAFLTNVNETVGENSRYIHKGLTSSDVIDTALALQLKDASAIIKNDLAELIETLKNKAKENRDVVCVGRSHGVIAEPMTLGLKFCNWIAMFERATERFLRAASDIEVGQISGPIGTYSNISPLIEKLTCEQLGLTPAKISTQIIARDYHAYYLQSLSLLASAIEQCATEIRHLQRTEVLELEEGFVQGQKGSSAMPHKRNPIASENLCGLARIMRANAQVALENIALWHERDISHSSTERIILPDATILINYMLQRFRNTVEHLNIFPNNMLRNMNTSGGIIFSQRVLIALTEKGLSREEAYSMVQQNAFRAFNRDGGDFKAELLSDDEVLAVISPEEIEECFNYEYFLRNIEEIYSRFEI